LIAGTCFCYDSMVVYCVRMYLFSYTRRCLCAAIVIKHVVDVGSALAHNSNINIEVTQENNYGTILYCFLDIDDYNRGSPTYIYPEYVLEFGKRPHNKRTGL
jgi:hypothetical protein